MPAWRPLNAPLVTMGKSLIGITLPCSKSNIDIIKNYDGGDKSAQWVECPNCMCGELAEMDQQYRETENE
jgi:hypothetical protein